MSVLIQAQQTRADEQALMLDRLEPWERAELARLIAKAEDCDTSEAATYETTAVEPVIPAIPVEAIPVDEP